MGITREAREPTGDGRPAWSASGALTGAADADETLRLARQLLGMDLIYVPGGEEPAEGAWVEVPVLLSHGGRAGTLRCGNRSLGRREARILALLARLLADQLEQVAGSAGGPSLERERRLEIEQTDVGTLLTALEARDGYSGRHTDAVVELVLGVGRELGLSGPRLRELGRVALLHDIGKLHVPDAILQKRGPLDHGEWELVRGHPAIGAEMVAANGDLAPLAPAVRAEHERWDGAGYPDGLVADETPLASRIVFACDAFHAMCSHRPYRSALSEEEALHELKAGAGSQFWPPGVEALLEVLPHVRSTPAGRWRRDGQPRPSPV